MAPLQQDFGMSLFSLLAALLLEQVRPLSYGRWVEEPLSRLANFLEQRCNTGERHSGMIAWLFAVGVLMLVSAGVHFLLSDLSPLLGWLWTVLVLYAAMGLGQFGRHYSGIQQALRVGDVAQARKRLAEWRRCPADGLSSAQVARLAIEEALCVSHRHLFGVLACFLLLPGPAGAALYRVSAFLAGSWDQCGDDADRNFGSFARRTFAIIDWVPVRLTAASFAIVGNFEDAVDCWRAQADKWPADGLSIVVASGAGALGVQLGTQASRAAERSAIGTGDEPDVDFMASTVGLVWRALVLWLLVLLLFGLASLVGG